MKAELLFATQNSNKVKEISLLLEGKFHLLSLSDLAYTDDIPETGDTLEANALQKAHFVYRHFNKNCFADDTGLEVEALDGAPGVYSARYAGPQRNDQDNMRLLLEKLEAADQRKARFRTLIALILEGREYLFEGEVQGHIAFTPEGKNGFGYDPLFIPEEGDGRTFAQMSLQEKNLMSHRARAFQKMKQFLMGL